MVRLLQGLCLRAPLLGCTAQPGAAPLPPSPGQVPEEDTADFAAAAASLKVRSCSRSRRACCSLAWLLLMAARPGPGRFVTAVTPPPFPCAGLLVQRDWWQGPPGVPDVHVTRASKKALLAPSSRYWRGLRPWTRPVLYRSLVYAPPCRSCTAKLCCKSESAIRLREGGGRAL